MPCRRPACRFRVRPSLLAVELASAYWPGLPCVYGPWSIPQHFQMLMLPAIGRARVAVAHCATEGEEEMPRPLNTSIRHPAGSIEEMCQDFQQSLGVPRGF